MIMIYGWYIVLYGYLTLGSFFISDSFLVDENTLLFRILRIWLLFCSVTGEEIDAWKAGDIS